MAEGQIFSHLASALVAKTKKCRRFGVLKGRMKLRGDIIYPDTEDDWGTVK